MEDRAFTLRLDHRGGYKFAVDFGLEGVPHQIVDEPVPIGDGEGPPASRMLAAAAAQCLASSLIFCLKKARVELRDLGVEVQVRMERNEKGRLRIPEMTVLLSPDLAPEDVERFQRCRQLFEDFCIVTQSVRSGIDVKVEVEPAGAAAAVRPE
jgi:organic hydroperoxide reductase OsmC/OhrA